jgi:uncharacterized protein YndB with AHSA1/START domain
MMDSPKTMVRCQRAIPHPANKVFEAFLNPAILRQWYGPRNTTVGDLQVEPYVGGRFDIELISERFGRLWVRGFFKEITPYSQLCYSFIFDPDLTAAGDSLVTVSLQENEGNTEVNVVQTLEKAIDPTGRTQGWQDILDNLTALLTAQ